MKEILNQIFDIAQKSEKKDIDIFDRNIRRLYHEIEALGYVLKNPIGEKYSLERTDIEATLMNDFHSKMKITKVLKPIVYSTENGQMVLVQKGVVIAE
ncbi:hypothetical protein [uncultured Tenacibaculum sp.]|uniref:hypothetical protein n=1 Tax=uncultured Tenacibaculum sp. TaxID=174713 RepID=UPI0026217ADB|nr:hypothetical protein [uncultured Tenacibaculum sp.]